MKLYSLTQFLEQLPEEERDPVAPDLSVYFYFDFVFASSKLKKLEQEWLKLQPQATVLNSLRDEVEVVLKPQNDFVERFIKTPAPLTSVLAWASEFLPETSWLTEISLEQDDKGRKLLIKGLCVPGKNKDTIGLIEEYLQKLKGKMPNTALTLTTTRLEEKDVQLTQFVATFSWGAQPAK